MSKKDIFSNIYSVYIKIDGREYYIGVSDIEECYFIEDIFSYSIVGKIQFNDRNGIMEFGPITGNEEIGIVYGESNEKERIFDIFKMSKVLPTQTSKMPGRSNYIEILFVDKMFYNLNDNVYSTSWSNVLQSRVIYDIGTQLFEIDFYDFENTNEKFDLFYMPYWTPKQTIDWVSKRGSGSISKKPGYLFFNNSNGTNYVTLEKLLQQQELMTVNDNDDGIYQFETSNVVDYNKILGYQLSGLDNHAKRELKGGYRLGLDAKTKKFLQDDYTYTQGISNFTLLGRKSLFNDISDSNTKIENYGEKEINIINNIYFNEWIKRYSMQQTLNVIVTGHEERYAGGMIEILWPSANEKEIYNKNLAGKYLIKSIIHQFGSGKPGYRQKMILIKNAYEDSDNTDLVSATNRNLGN